MKEGLRDFLLSFFSSENYQAMRVKEMADFFGLTGESRSEFYDLIDELLLKEKIRMSKRGKIVPYSSKKSKKHNKEKLEQEGPLGRLEGNKKGFAFFIPEDPDQEDVFISGDDLNGALNGDLVEVKIKNGTNRDGDKKPEGQVVKIVERNQKNIVGRYRDMGDYGFVLPDLKSYFKDIYIPKGAAMSAKENDKVLVKLDKFPMGEENPEGHVIMVIGPQGGKGVDISSVALSFDLPYIFSEESLKEAEKLPDNPKEAQIRDRKDLRDLFTVTIDGADAKDFDDAISIEKEGDNFSLYVHIADVSHYVKEGGSLDKEAYLRGNSVYLLDRVIPMLPEKLSNGLCSLKPGETRLAMTTKISCDSRGKTLDYKFFPSVIRSNHRLVYEDVSDYLELGKVFSDDKELFNKLDLMGQLYKCLDKIRRDRGSMDFDMPESSISLDEKGKAVQVEQEERRIANKIIEEFMILNNEVVGRHFFNLKLPYIYRVHGNPDPDAIDRLNDFLTILNYPRLPEDPNPKDIKKLLDKAKGSPEEGILNIMVLRSMQKAVYSSSPDIHFGLACDHYSHFTAPIRRYSDIIAHRLLKASLAGKAKKDDKVRKQLFTQCRHISECEEKAEEAERDVIDMKCAEYMEQFVGQEFEGIVSSLTNFGIFIMLENTVEGLAHFRDMTDDYYTFDEKSLTVIGERTRKKYHYGDKVKVLLTGSNPETREIDFKILAENRGPKRKSPKKAFSQAGKNRLKYRKSKGRRSGKAPNSFGKHKRKRKSRKGR